MAASEAGSARSSPERSAFVISLLYLAAGVLWVLFSDQVILGFAPSSARLLTKFQSVKGVVFVVATASVLYPLLRRGLRGQRPRERVREATEDTRAWLERASDAILVLDRQGRVLEVNALACAMFGYSAPELLRIRTQYLVTPDDLSGPLPLSELREGRASRLERRLQRKDGTSFRGRLDATLLQDGRVLVAIRHQTERHAAADEPNRAERVPALRALPSPPAPQAPDELARRAQKMEALGRLAGGVAHDFNNLLTAILGYGDLARRALAEDHPVRAHVDEILKAADRGAELTRQLLAFSRHQVGEQRPLSLTGVVAEVESMLRRLIGEDVVLVTRLEPAAGRIRADRAQIDQVILNLAVNARDAMPAGGTLLIETAAVQVGEAEASRQPEARPGPYVRLTVADTGCGMEPAVKEHAFEPFFTTKEEGKGTGLGLATVYGVVQQSGGFIAVDSEPDRGTIFQLFFPRVEDTLTALRNDPPARANGGRETVMVVEDEAAVRDLMHGVLSDSGYTVLRARHAAEALDLLSADRDAVEVMVVDLVLPGMSGVELAKRVKALHPRVKVLFVSGYAADSGSRAQLDGAFLQKPFAPDALMRKIREVIDGRLPPGSVA